LLLRRALADGISLYPSERDLAHSPLNVAGSAALPWPVLHRSHSVCSVILDLAIPSVNNELAGFLRSNAFPRSLDRLALSGANLAGANVGALVRVTRHLAHEKSELVARQAVQLVHQRPVSAEAVAVRGVVRQAVTIRHVALGVARRKRIGGPVNRAARIERAG